MKILTMLKMLLGMDTLDISKDEILNFTLENSKIKISNYLRDLYVPNDAVEKLAFETKYFNAIIELAKYDYKNQKATGIKQYSESKRSVTYKDSIDGIPSQIKAMLPKPSIVMF
ncbi:phage head-tail connector protein [Clostridium tagluense]|uniref:Phage gp6-like head-tail connector protein n=1 Tax=Clostridium tagluense TaxID=360422 RepID=A0A401ULQ3_9CLOT|nr:phage head-tail connector protein [Clostridium tagluense]GCD10463.1 hypothetical protein Ctaglu_20860 [Clostridium tagluense]